MKRVLSLEKMLVMKELPVSDLLDLKLIIWTLMMETCTIWKLLTEDNKWKAIVLKINLFSRIQSRELPEDRHDLF